MIGAVLEVMGEIGIDLTEAKPQKLTEELAQGAQLLITMGCGDKCPYVPGLRRDEWPLRDPKGLPWMRCGQCAMTFETASQD